ncbi:MAG: branched-subunit amino acid transport protein [Celeribacter sp.]|jgi:branched-subunit amino acid transport protein
MALSYKARRRVALWVLVVGLPVYIAVCLKVVSLFERPSMWVELAIYVGMGILWAIPLKSVFMGIGQPDASTDQDLDDA